MPAGFEQAFGEGFRGAGWLAGSILGNMCVISAVSAVSHAAVAAGVRFGVGVSVIVMVSSWLPRPALSCGLVAAKSFVLSR